MLHILLDNKSDQSPGFKSSSFILPKRFTVVFFFFSNMLFIQLATGNLKGMLKMHNLSFYSRLTELE